jgi:hypothetical protein
MPLTLRVANSGDQTVQLDLQTYPPTAVIGSQVYKIMIVKLITASNTVHYIEPDDSRLHSTVSGFSTVIHFGAVLLFDFDSQSPLNILGHDNITQLVLFHSFRPMSENGIASIVTHNAHSEERECSICLETTIGPWFSVRGCGHKFHPSCIERWLNSASRRTCPLCRGGI